MGNKLWTPEEVETLRVLRCVEGKTVPQIAEAMNRPFHGVQKQIAKHEFELPFGLARTTPVSCRHEVMKKLREAFYNGVTIQEAANSVGLYQTTVSNVFLRFSDELLRQSNDTIDVGVYVGGKEMVAIAANACGVPVQVVLGKGRFRPAVLARMAVVRALRDRGISLSRIARVINRGDHTTVLNLLNNFPAYSAMYWELNRAYKAIKDAEQRGAERLAA